MAWAPAYATTAELRTSMRVPAVTVDATDILQDTTVYTPALAAASRMIDWACNRQFGVVTSEARYYTAVPVDDYYVVYVDDTQASVTLAVDLAGALTYSTTVTDFAARPLNASAKGLAVTRLVLGPSAAISTIEGRYKATSAWGWTSVPSIIKAATLIQATRLVKRRDAPFGVAGSPEFGSEVRLLAKLDPDVEAMVTVLRRYV